MIFVDSSFWVALVSKRDANHQDAVTLLRDHGRARLLTSAVVRGETWTFLRRRLGHDAAVRFLDLLDQTSRCQVQQISSEVDTQALAWLKQRDEREYSYVDATSFSIMRQLRIENALAFDGDFSAAGFVELRPGT